MKNKILGLIGGAGLIVLGGCAQPPPAGAVQATAAPVAPTDPPDSPAEVSASVQSEGPVAAPDNISPGAAEVIRLASSGVAEDVIIAYVNNSQTPFGLTADQVVYLKDLGISPQVVTAMINRDAALRSQPTAVVATTPPPTAPPVEPAQPPVVEAPMTPVAETTTPPEDVSYFYSDLAPYGTWVTLEGVGWCWQPRTVVVSHGWRPYCDGGHWVYSDCGWYWESDYSWGWAPFHYGRWYLHPRCGWVWTPDRVWGPAWVSWRQGGDNCGWAPLPPHAVFDVHTGWRFNGVHVAASFDFGLRPDHFTFVAVRDFTHHDLGHRVVPVHEVRNVYRQTTIINNTTVVQNNVIVNRGIPVDKVSTVTHMQIKPAVLRDAGPGSGQIRNGPDKNRTETVVYRHELPAKPKPARVTAERVDASHPVINHTELARVRNDRTPSSSSSSDARSRPDNNTRQHTTPATTVTRPQPRTRENAPVAASPGKAPAPLIMKGNSTKGTAPVAEGPKTPADPRRDRSTPSAQVQKPASAPAKAPEVSKPIEMPRPSQNSGAYNYGRYGNPAPTTPPLPSPKQSAPETARYSERSSDYSSPRSSTTHEYLPKTSQQRNENYTAPGHSSSAPGQSSSAPGHSYSPPAARSEQSQSHSQSSGGSSSQGNSGSRDDSGSHKGKDK
jgi:hypothetical protein